MNINLTLIAQLISFVVFVWFTMKYVWPPITRALQERQNKIADGLAAAERGHHEMELARKRATEELHEAKAQASEIIQKAEKRAAAIIDEAKDDARVEGERILVAARAQAEQEMNEAREQLRKEVGALALAGAEQILMREIDESAHRELLDKLAAEL